jgi:hypothetical protein
MAREMGSTHPHYHHKHLKAYGQVSKYGHWR